MASSPKPEDDVVYRLRKRAEIRRQISTRKSVQEGKPDRIADLLEEAARDIQELREALDVFMPMDFNDMAVLTALTDDELVKIRVRGDRLKKAIATWDRVGRY